MLIYAGQGRQPPVNNALSTVRVISQISIILSYRRNPYHLKSQSWHLFNYDLWLERVSPDTASVFLVA